MRMKWLGNYAETCRKNWLPKELPHVLGVEPEKRQEKRFAV